VGFHAQQAVEKLLKALLNHRRVVYPRTHDLEILLKLLTKTGLIPPAEICAALALTPFAVNNRYGETPTIAAIEPSRETIQAWVVATRQWVDSLMGPPQTGRNET
jgi:HEPN domain-containing protein